jgi:hypothetical protein
MFSTIIARYPSVKLHYLTLGGLSFNTKFANLVLTKTLMKKSLLFIALFICTGKLMAQKSIIAPFDNTLSGKLIQPFKADSTWRTAPPSISIDKLFLPQPIDLDKMKFDKNDRSQKQLIIADNEYKMPVARLNGYSKMPVIKLEGNSKMPVAGKTKTDVKVTP